MNLNDKIFPCKIHTSHHTNLYFHPYSLRSKGADVYKKLLSLKYCRVLDFQKTKFTFCMCSSAPPVIKISFPLSSIVTDASFSKVIPAANGCPGLLKENPCQIYDE
jgi:hypothetical protein